MSLLRRPLLVLTLLPLLASSSALAVGGRARAISEAHDGNAMVPRISRDGRQVSFEVNYPSERHTELFVHDLASGSEEPVRPPVGSSAIGNRFRQGRVVTQEMAWGDQMHAFAASAGENFDVYLNLVQIPIGGNLKEGAPAISADSNYLAYCSATGDTGHLFLLDIMNITDNGSGRAEGVKLTQERGGFEFYPTWAHGGSQLAFVRSEDDGHNIHVARNVGQGTPDIRQITNWPESSLKPSFSPDDQWIAFFSNHGNDNGQIFDLYIVPSDGSGSPRRLLQNVVPNERYGPAWSPDGSYVFVAQNDANNDDPLMAVPAGGGSARALSTGTRNNADPVVGTNADGNWILAFVAQGEQGQDEARWKRIYTYEMAPGDPR